MSDREQLTYLRNNDLRAEIVRAVGGDSAPYETAETSYDEPSELTLRELYDTLDAAVPGMDHSHNAGNTWGIARGNLKALHRAVNDDAPLVTDGGSDVCRDESERSVGTCGTEGCHRKAVVTHTYADPETFSRHVEADLCLPCRRVVEHARGIPWNDESEEWHDVEALRDYRQDGNVTRRYIESDQSEERDS